jgi:hypothetical protein
MKIFLGIALIIVGFTLGLNLYPIYGWIGQIPNVICCFVGGYLFFDGLIK